jgi:hypothetical protein
MVGRFADRRVHLRLGMAAGAGGVGMRPVDGGVHRHHPVIQSITPASAPAACSRTEIAAHTPASCQARNSP